MLSDVYRVQLVGGRRVRPTGWLDGAYWLIVPGRPGSRLPLRASIAGLGGGISWRPSAYSLLSPVLALGL